MFESLRKKFSETSGKLTKKLENEAEEEDNIESKETEDIITDVSDEVSSSVDDGFESLSDVDGVSDGSDSQDVEDSDLEDNEKSGFFSSFKRDSKNKNESDNEDIISENDDDCSDLSSQSKDNEKSGFFSSFRRGSKEDVDSEDKDDVSDEVSSSVDDGFESLSDGSDSDDVEVVDSGDNEKSGFFSSFRRGSKDKEPETNEDSRKGKGGFFSFIKEKTLSENDVEDILFELEMSLLEGDVAMDVASTVVDSVKDDLIGQKIKRSSDIEEYTYDALKNAVSKIIDIKGKSFTEMIEMKKKEGEPLVVMFVGINGTGKTTTIGKLSSYYLKKGYTPVIAASDTFRAGAIEQVTYHANNVGVKIIKHEKGSDPAAVAFDAVAHAKAHNKELVLIDTAGRMQTNTNLMDEMKKIKRVAKPDLVIFVGDALTGNDATEQATKFNDAIDIDGVILTKADADAKGGASLSIGYVIKKPIMFLGMGQGYDDIIEYDADWMLNQLFAES
ncbi:signal recognition particle-docking protein FtsY [Methanobrevibacter acididurans]|uniref:signal recognition particle-docking protein FtsY n=1 Tax=Methanobrevibacter acididurans TaxID=120963 RepID=UPI0038FD030D